MKTVVLGGTGQVGWELQRSLAPLGSVVALDRERHGSEGGDLENADAVRHTLRRLAPDVIVNAAAYTDVDGAEREPERAQCVNAAGPALLAAEAQRLGAWLIQYSTDYVFDGSGARPWREDDRAAPRSVYGATKWDGEQAVRASGCRHLIVRTQWIYSARRRNFIRTMLRLAAERSTLEVVDDQIGAPTGADLVADVTAHVVRSLERLHGSGTYHLAARGATSRHGCARFVVECARRAGMPLALSADAIAPVTSADYPTPAERPLNSRLDVARLEQTFGLTMPDWRSGVERVVTLLTESRREAAGGRA